MNRVEIKKIAKGQIRGKIFTIFLMTLLVLGITIACNSVVIIGNIAYAIIAPGISLGFLMIYLKIANGKEIAIDDIFNGLNIFGKALWLQILVAFYTFLWTLLLYIPGIVKSLSYSASTWILANNPELTASEALSKSKKVMEGHKWDLFILQLSFIPWYILVALTFGIASIYVNPYFEVTLANFYKNIGAFDVEI